MSKKDDISATERLLDLIRQEKSPDGVTISHPGQQKTPSEIPINTTAPLALEREDKTEEEIPSPRVVGQDESPIGTTAEDSDTAELEEAKGPLLRNAQQKDSVVDEGAEIPKAGDPGKVSVLTGTEEKKTTTTAPPSLVKGLPFLPTSGNLRKFSGASAGIAFYPDRFAVVVLSFQKGRYQVSGYHLQPYKHGNAELPGFPEILETSWLRDQVKTCLDQLIGRKKIALWSVLPDEISEIHYVSVPKAASKDLASAVFWGAKQQVGFEEATSAFDYAYRREFVEKNVPKLMNLVFLGSKNAVDFLSEFFKSINYPLAGITSTSIAVENLFRQKCMGPPSGAISHLQIDESRSVIDVFLEGELIFSREINTGISSFTEYLIETSMEMGIVLNEDEARILAFHKDIGSMSKHPAYREFILEDRHSINFDLPASGRLFRQLQRTFDFCVTNFGIPRIEKVFISGLPSMSDPFIDFLHLEMDLNVEALDPFQSENMHFAPAMVHPSCPEKIALVFPLAIAISDSKETQNFLLTSKEKEKNRRTGKTNRIILVVAAVITFCLLGVSFQLSRGVVDGEATLRNIAQEFRTLNPMEDNEIIKTRLLVKAGQIKKLEEDTLSIANRYAPVALLDDITKRIPRGIKIIRLKLAIDREKPDEKEENDLETITLKKNPQIMLFVDGYIEGSQGSRELVLAEVLKELGKSPLLGKEIHLKGKKEINFLGEDVLKFKIYAKMNSLHSGQTDPVVTEKSGT